MKSLVRAALLALALPLAAQAAPDEGATVRIDFSNPSLSPAVWTLTLRPDGSGHFKAQPGAPTKNAMDVPAIDRPVQLSPVYARYVLGIASSLRVLTDRCESHMKVAFQGWKTISYKDAAVSGSCRFNYSKDKEIQELSNSVLAVASTLVEGRRLEMLLEHDPLGLDKEMDFLVEGVADGRVKQICAIHGILERLAQDETIMERVRRRARGLLARADSGN